GRVLSVFLRDAPVVPYRRVAVQYTADVTIGSRLGLPPFRKRVMDLSSKAGLAKPVLVSDDGAVRRPSREQAMEAVRTLIAWAGDDPSREGLIDTPRRVVDAYGDWFQGY